jgi:endoglucanase
VLEPDGLALLPTDCGYTAQNTADRFTQINYAVAKLEANPATIVYLDAGHSAWHSVGDMAVRLVQGGVLQTQGFISKCIAFANDPEEGGWRLGHYDWCASQYYSPAGSVDPNDISTWHYTDQWFDSNLGTAVPTTHFLIDTSRNGQGPLDASVYKSAPYNQPEGVIGTLNAGSWCNPPARGLGLKATANTGVPLLDAFLWIKVPGESDGSCNAQGGVRAWDYTAYSARMADGLDEPGALRSALGSGGSFRGRVVSAAGFGSGQAGKPSLVAVSAGWKSKIDFCRYDGRPEWIRTIDLFRVKEAL